MDSFIEVRGETAVTESVVEYRADLMVSVRAAHVEVAAGEVEELRSQCIRALKDAGLAESEMTEGAGEVWHPWFWKKKAGHEVSRKILLACPEANRLYRALGSLEPLFANQRFSIWVGMRTPKFEAPPESRTAAQTAAIADARRSAETVARAAGVALGRVVQIEEIDERVGRSGQYGDEDWRGLTIAAGPGSGEDAPEDLGSATRTRALRYRVRFAVNE